MKTKDYYKGRKDFATALLTALEGPGYVNNIPAILIQMLRTAVEEDQKMIEQAPEAGKPTFEDSMDIVNEKLKKIWGGKL